MKTVKMTVKTVMNIIILSFGKWGSAKSPILAVPAVSTVDKQAIEVTWKKKDNDYSMYYSDWNFDVSRFSNLEGE